LTIVGYYISKEDKMKKTVLIWTVLTIIVFSFGIAVATPPDKTIPFQTTFECQQDNAPNCVASSDKEIPEGMRLVIEYVSGRILVPKGNTVEVEFRVADPDAENGLIDFRVPAYLAGETVTGTTSIYAVSEKVLVFGYRTTSLSRIIMYLYSPYPVETPSIRISGGLLTGYLEPVPKSH
jgi:hypothetical protein